MATLTTSFNIIVNEVFVPSKSKFTNGSWDDVRQMIEQHDGGQINLYDYVDIGDTRPGRVGALEANDVFLSDRAAQDIQWRVIGKNVKSTADGNKCHLVLKLWTWNDPKFKIHTTSENNVSWRDCAGRTWLNADFFNALDDVKTLIMPVTNWTGLGGMSLNVVNSSDAVWLEAYEELTGTTTYYDTSQSINRTVAARGEGKQFDYYKSNPEDLASHYSRTPTLDSTSQWMRINVRGGTPQGAGSYVPGFNSFYPCICI